MSALIGNPLLLTTAPSADGDAYQIEKSLRFNPGDTPYLYRTFGSGNRKTFTWSGWCKRHKLSTRQMFLQPDSDNGTDTFYFCWDDSDADCIQVGDYDSSWNFELITKRRFRDTSAWYHVCLAVDTTQSIEALRVRLWVNGELQEWANNSFPTQNFETHINKNVQHDIGRLEASNVHAGWSLADVHFIDGLALSPAAFGSFDSLGIWNPKAFALPAPNDGRTWSSNTANLTNPANAFDGDTSSSGTKASSGAGQVSITFNPPLTNVVEFEHNSHNGGNHMWAFNGGTLTEDSGGSASEGYWRKPPSGMKIPSTINSFQVRYGPADDDASVELAGIRVNGVVLVDGQTDPTTRNNPNDGRDWSTYGTMTGNNDPDAAFDGIHTGAGSYWYANHNTSIVWSNLDIPCSRFRVYCHDFAGSPGDMTLGTDDGNKTATGADEQWIEFDLGDATKVTSLTIPRGAGGNYNEVSLIEVDNHLLLEGATDNSFHLKFNDTSLNRSLGKDTLKKVSDATGGLPFYNTSDDYGDVKGSGYRADSSAGTTDGTGLVLAMPGDTLTDLHASINTGSSNNSFTTVGTVATTTDQSRFYGTSMDFGTADGNYLKTTSANSDFALGTGAFTIEAWYYLNSDGGWDQGILQLSNAEGVGTYNQSGGISIYTGVGSGGTINLIVGNATYASFGSHNGFNKGWHHFAGTRDSSGVCRVFVDGVLGNVTNTSAHDITATYLSVGAYGSTSYSWHGMLNDIRIYKGVCKYNTNFKPPTRNDFTVTNLNATTSVTDTTTDTIKNWRCYKTYHGTSGYGVYYDLQWSNDNTNWTNAVSNGLLTSGNTGCGWIEAGNPAYSGSQTAKYWRLKTKGVQSGTHAPRTTKIEIQKQDNSWIRVQTWSNGDESCNDQGEYQWHEGGSAGDTWTWTGSGSYSEVKAEEIDSHTDTPTNYGEDTGVGGEVRGNYCTWNPLLTTDNGTYTEGNLKVANGGSGCAQGTIGVSSGKWYWEHYIENEAINSVGISQAGDENSEHGSTATMYTYKYNAQKWNNNSNVGSYGASWTDGDYIGVALDLDGGTLTFYKNGSTQGTAFTSLSGTFFPSSGRHSGSAPTIVTNFGQRTFKYAAPAGYKCLCSANLPDTFSGAELNNPSKFFDVKTYTGNGSTNYVKDVGFQPELVWVKSRSNNYDHLLFDKIRSDLGNVYDYVKTNSTDQQATGGTTALTAYNSDGFTMGADGAMNTDGSTFVSWMWDAGTAEVTPSSSYDITPDKQWVNTTAGFSITKYTGNNTNSTVPHGLNAAPDFMIHKMYSENADWQVWHGTFSGTQFLQFANTAVMTQADMWNSTVPNDNVFYLGNGNGTNKTGADIMMYCWTAIPGYSAFGSYEGNGNANGPFIYTGFSPRFVLIKDIDSTHNWYIFDIARDGINPIDEPLYPDGNYQEQGDDRPLDILSNGFKVRHTTYFNDSAKTNVYAAFAEHPMKTSRAR